MRILVINPGATSTKVGLYDEENRLFQETIIHAGEDLDPFARTIDQLEYRLDLIEKTLAANDIKPGMYDAVCGRGGLLRPIPSGTYLANDKAVEDMHNAVLGEHASNLGLVLARRLADKAGVKAYFVDPVSVDELQPLARVTGMKGIERRSQFHALNHKAAARMAAKELGKPYEELNLIVAHMGGGVSVAAHEKGKVVDIFNPKDEGGFSVDRAGALPVNPLIEFCFSGKTYQEVRKILAREAGIYSYLGTTDFLEVENRALKDGDKDCLFYFEAMAYQYAKDIGAMAAVLGFDVDAIVFTGGIANGKAFVNLIRKRVEKIAPILVYPGEEEMRSLADGALRVLQGEEAKVY